MLDLGDHASRSVPGGGLIREAPIPDQRRIAGSASGRGEQVDSGQRKGRVGSDDDGLLARASSHSVRTVDVAGPERGGQAVAVLVEDEERMIADGLEVAIVG